MPYTIKLYHWFPLYITQVSVVIVTHSSDVAVLVLEGHCSVMLLGHNDLGIRLSRP